MAAMGEPKIDCHCHILDPQCYPYQVDARYRPARQEIGTAGQLAAVGEAYQVRHCLLVGPNSGYGHDNRYLLDTIAADPARYKGIAVVPNDASVAMLSELKARGIVGIAVNATYHGVDYYAEIGPLVQRLEQLDMFLQIQVEGDQLLALQPLLQRSGVRLLIDHCGRPVVSAGLDQPGFRALLALGESRRAVVKLSGLQKFSAQRHPYVDTWPYVQALVAAFGLDACVWGSDWPFLRATERMDYGPLLLTVERLFPSADDRRKIFVDTPRRLFGFGP